MPDGPLMAIASMATLREGWDSYGAPAVGDQALRMATELVRSLWPVPTVNGGVAVSIANEAITVEFAADGSLANCFVDVKELTDWLAAKNGRQGASDG